MEKETFLVKFGNVSPAEANVLAESLRQELLSADSGVEAETRRDSEETMDFGATLVLVLGTPAALAAARALIKWAGRNNAASLRLETGDGILLADNLESKDAAAIVRAFAARRTG